MLRKEFFGSLLLLVCLFGQECAGLTISCRDQNGKDLDWFIGYKFPKDSSSSYSNILNGTGYAAITNVNEDFTYATPSFESESSMVGQTLKFLYSTDFKAANNKLGYIMYNDQSPLEGATDPASRAHAKGVIAFDDKNLFWLVHSIPKFPPPASKGKYSIDPSQCKFGQSMICMSMDLKANIQNVLDQMRIAWTQVYDYYIPQSSSFSSALNDFVQGGRIKDIDSRMVTFKTNGGQEFFGLHKASKFGKDLYQDLVLPKLNCTTSHAETWTNGVGTVNSVCTCPTSVYNINTLKTPYISFKNSNDHSKWTVGMDKSTPRYLCIGDINRQASQFTRGGGTICINKKPNLAAKYFSFINTVDGCTAGTETEIAKVSYCN